MTCSCNTLKSRDMLHFANHLPLFYVMSKFLSLYKLRYRNTMLLEAKTTVVTPPDTSPVRESDQLHAYSPTIAD